MFLFIYLLFLFKNTDSSNKRELKIDSQDISPVSSLI